MIQAPERRRILSAVIVLVGCLQAWHSEVHAASPLVWVLVAAGILVPAVAALVTEGVAAIFVAIPVSAALLLAAGWISATPLPMILVVAVAAGALLLLNLWVEKREEEEAGGS